MHKITMGTIKDIENIRAQTVRRQQQCVETVANLTAQKDVTIKKLTESEETYRTKLKNQHAKNLADIQAKITSEKSQFDHSIQQQKTLAQAKLDEKKLTNEKDKNSLEQETRKKLAELDKEKVTILGDLEMQIQKKRIAADVTINDTTQR